MTVRSALAALRDVLLPSGAVLAGVAVLVHWHGLADAVPAATRYAPPVILTAGLLLAWRFHRGRVALALVMLALAEVGLVVACGDPVRGPIVEEAVAVLVPANLAVLALLPERGTLTVPGLLQWGGLALQIPIVWLLAYPTPAPAADLLLQEPFPAALFRWSRLEAMALGSFAVGGAALLLGAVLRPNATGRGFLWAAVAAFLALQSAEVEPARRLYLAAGGLLLAVSVIEASYFMAYRDGLTGLRGRRAFDEALLRLGTRFAVAMVDVDHFKRVNDRHGHNVGDQVLRKVATQLARIGGGGRAYRYGGEEFAILFAGKAAADVLPHVEAARQTVEAVSFKLRAADRPKEKPDQPRRARATAKTFAVTISAGVAEATDRKTPPAEVVRAADQALYRAKQGGRNRVVRG